MPKRFSPSKPTARRGPPLSAATAYLISQVGRTQAARFGEGLQPLGLRPKHFALLNLIDLNPGTSQHGLGEHLALEPSGLVKTIDELEAQGNLERRRDPADRRRHALYLTDSGNTKLNQARQATGRRAAELLAPLNHDEQQVLHDLLARVAAAT